MISNNVLHLFVRVGATAGFLGAVTVGPVVASPVTYTIDPGVSGMAVSGPATTNPGALTGEVAADVFGGALTFSGGSSISGIGPFRGSAGYSKTAKSGPLTVEVSGTANVVYSNFTFDLFGGPISSGGNVTGLSLQPLTGQMEGTTKPTVKTTFSLPPVLPFLPPPPPIITTVTLDPVTFSADYAGHAPLSLQSGSIGLTDDGITEILDLVFSSGVYNGNVSIDAIDFGNLGKDFESHVEGVLAEIIAPFARVAFVAELDGARLLPVVVAAVPEFDPEPLDFGVHRVGSGDVVRTLTVTNAAVGEEGFVDRLAGTLAVAAGSTPPFSGSGNLGGGLESLESTGIDFTLTTDAAGSFTGAIEAALTSENDTMDPLALDVPPLVMTGQVNNLANPGFAFGGGDGLFQGLGGGRFVLDFGTVDIADGPVSAELLVTNEFVFVGAPQDDLGGSFTFDGDTVFATLGFGAFADLAAGISLGGFEISLDPEAAGVGTYTSFIGLLGLSTFAGLPDLTPEELELALGYLPELELKVVVTPLPASVWFLGSALAALGAAAARRRRAQAAAA